MLNGILIETCRAAIANCDLGHDHGAHAMDLADEYSMAPQSLRMMDPVDQEPEAFVASDTIVSIVSGMSQANRQAVKDCILFASLAANKKYRDTEDAVQWYQQFINVLSYCGWATQSSGFTDHRTSNTRFTMEQEALKILESVILSMALPGPTSVLLLKVAKDTIDVLQASDKPLRLFENSSKTRRGAKFAIGSAMEAEDGEVVIGMGALNFHASQSVTNVLFWEWSSSAVQIKRAEHHLFLNVAHYERVKDLVEEKLTEKAREALSEFEI